MEKMVSRVRDEIRDMRRRAQLDGYTYTPSTMPIKLTQAQWDAFLLDPYLWTLHTQEEIEALGAAKQYLGHPITIVED